MKKILIALLLGVAQTSHAQDCEIQAANKPSTLVRFPDETDKPGDGSKVTINLPKINYNLSKAENWVKGILKYFTGAKLAYSNNYLFDYSPDPFYKATGIKGSYYAQMRFFAYYCNGNKIDIEGESGSAVMVYINDVFKSYDVHSLCMDKGVFTINGKPAFKLYEKKRTVGRIDFYERMWQNTVNDTVYASKDEFIIIRNSDQPVFIPITRKEYLEQMLKDIGPNRESQIAFAKSMYDPKNEAKNKAEFDAALKRIDNSKNSTPEQMAPYRKRFIETWETEKQKFDKQITRIETETKGAKEVVLEYLKKPSEWLSRSLKQFHTYNEFNPKGLKSFFEELDVFRFSSGEETRTQLVTLNPAYYNKSLGADVPQLIMLHLPKGGYPHMKKVAELIHKPGALKPLENILTPGKNPAEQPFVVTTSQYKLSYLPKLTKLTPLVVPADMKPSMIPLIPDNNSTSLNKMSFEIPPLSPKLKQLPAQPLTSEAYKNYLLELFSNISIAIKPESKKKADDYIANKKITLTKDISNAAFSAWLQNAPDASLYLYSKAVVNDPSDALAANNFSAFLMMGGLPEKSIPILEFVNKQKPGESTLLANLGNAYYRLGDINKAMNYLQQCVQKDSLHPTANKLLCMIYLKKGDAKKAEDHGTRSLTASYDHEVISMISQVNKKIKPGEIMSRWPIEVFPLAKRTKLPAMPSRIDEMNDFIIELDAEKKSLQITLADINSKIPENTDDLQQQILKSRLLLGTFPFSIKAQYIIMDEMQVYQEQSIKTADVFKYNVKKLAAIYNPKTRAIIKEYNDKLSKHEGGEAGDEAEIQSLEMAKCKEINAANEKYLGELAPLVNGYAQRQEFISRKFYNEYANWAPVWAAGKSISFPSIERDYLKDIASILSDYKIISKLDCSPHEPPATKDGVLKEWEDEYCSNFKGKIAAGPVKFFFTCNSWGVDGGEGIVGDIEFKYRNNGIFESFTVGAGIGANLHLGKEGLIKTEAGMSFKDFIKIGPDEVTGKWIIKDVGVKFEIAGEATIGKVSVEEKVIEVSLGVNSGFEAGGIVPSVFNFK